MLAVEFKIDDPSNSIPDDDTQPRPMDQMKLSRLDNACLCLKKVPDTVYIV